MGEADQTYLQADQPEGVPPLELTGERTLPDVPEENYWYRRHVAVYEWIAERCSGLRVADLACGEGYGSDLLAPRAAEGVGGGGEPGAPQPRPARGRGDRGRCEPGGSRPRPGPLPPSEPELPPRARRGLRRAGRRGRLPPDDQAHPRARPSPVTDRRGCADRLHLDPQPADPRSARGREVRQPVASPRIRPGPVPRAARTALHACRHPRAAPRAQAASARAGDPPRLGPGP